MKNLLLMGMLLVACSTLAASVQAQDFTMLNFTSFMYESDNDPAVQGFPPSNMGDVLAAVGYVESLGPELDWDLGTTQITVVFYGLVSQGEIDLGNGLSYIIYSEGYLDVVADAYGGPGYTAPAYGTDPPNATAPAAFWDGDVYLHGEFYSFYMTYHATLHVGSFEGYLNWTGGSQLNTLYLDPEGYTVAGTVDPYSAPVPDGYDLEADGDITFDAAIETERSTWGKVKNLYR